MVLMRRRMEMQMECGKGGWYTYVKQRRIVGDLLAFKVDSKFDVVLIDRKKKSAISLSIFLCV
jgi:hypothetical protein